MTRDDEAAPRKRKPDGKVFRTLRLLPRTVEDLNQVATVWKCSPSAVVEELLAQVVRFGPERIKR